MKNFQRSYPLFSLCGLNCGLCPMHLGGHCPGCGGGEGNQSCALARCSLRHGGIDYCFQCGEYPCERYRSASPYDTFISHRNRMEDAARAKRIGPGAYRAELEEKIAILRRLLDGYNDGRRKTLFCNAANLLPLQELRCVMEHLEAERTAGRPIKERAAQAAALLNAAAERQCLSLRLRQKSR